MVLEKWLCDVGVEFLDFFVCLYVLVFDGSLFCLCCKLVLGLLLCVVCCYGIDLLCFWMVGDIFDDIEVGCCVGCCILLLGDGVMLGKLCMLLC